MKLGHHCQITYFNVLIILIKHDVKWRNISMDEIVTMQIFDSTQNLLSNLLDVW